MLLQGNKAYWHRGKGTQRLNTLQILLIHERETMRTVFITLGFIKIKVNNLERKNENCSPLRKLEKITSNLLYMRS